MKELKMFVAFKHFLWFVVPRQNCCSWPKNVCDLIKNLVVDTEKFVVDLKNVLCLKLSC